METCTSPSLPFFRSTNAPKSTTRVTFVVIVVPTSISAVRSSTQRLAACTDSMSTLANFTVPSSSMSIWAPVSSMILRIIFPPGPITSPIFSRGMMIVSNRGAYIDR